MLIWFYLPNCEYLRYVAVKACPHPRLDHDLRQFP